MLGAFVTCVCVFGGGDMLVHPRSGCTPLEKLGAHWYSGGILWQPQYCSHSN